MPGDGKLRHCRHCLGDNCPGDCLLGDGQCIHGWNGKRPRAVTWQLLLTRRWWYRVLWGPERSPRWRALGRFRHGANRHPERSPSGAYRDRRAR